MGSILRADPATWNRLTTNPPLLVGAFGWQLAHNLLTWILAFTGLYLGLRGLETRPFALTLLIILLYFHLTVAVVGVEAFARSRTPHMPYVFALAGLALARLGRSPAPPD
jgi:hypothetical protein